ncbi:MAG: lysophospholipid acyltransferase family protein [Myxococcota bacterium]|jgi:1-acyl-sn-glycerol-3-phosphate acyltransferase|nr:1-acyl-sn-glycerol-3-phosphate acyltransferase [Myxococcota bacterium]MBP8970810.1 1-acyl-sn-glycerol-3-phosphate acyltransferase [Myxococcota bacterium]HQC45512.1 lysophospholipid acyltransferase family protein [Myxococcota bacterium]HQL57710.1 lysophospholipid acyltransferase family protein [Myxococcota bacterium]
MTSADIKKPPRLYAIYRYLFLLPFFAVFTISLGIIAIPSTLISKRVAFWYGTIWAWVMCRLNFTPVKVVNRHKAASKQAYVMMLNHRSQMDIIAFYGHWHKQFLWVMKAELRKVPIIGWYTSRMGCLFLNRSKPELAMKQLLEAKPLLEKGISIMIFPEGTRSSDGKTGPFKKGGFVLAIESKLPILPISISGSREGLPPGGFKPSPTNIVITVHDPVATDGLTLEDIPKLTETVRNTILTGLLPHER